MSAALTRYRVMATIVGVLLVVLCLIGLPLHYGHLLHPGLFPVGSTAEQAGYSIGDTVPLVTVGQDSQIEAELVGTIEFSTGLVGATLTVFDTEELQRLFFDGDDVYTDVWVTGDGVSQEDLRESVAAAVAYELEAAPLRAPQVERAALDLEVASVEALASLVAQSSGQVREWALTEVVWSASRQLEVGGTATTWPGAPELDPGPG